MKELPKKDLTWWEPRELKLPIIPPAGDKWQGVKSSLSQIHQTVRLSHLFWSRSDGWKQLSDRMSDGYS